MTSQRHTTIKHVQTLLFLRLPFGCPSRTCCISYLWLPNGITANLAASDTFTNSVSGFVGLGTAWLGSLQGCKVLADRAHLRINREGSAPQLRRLWQRPGPCRSLQFLVGCWQRQISHLNTVTLGLGQLTQHGS